jgi:hypothetical protein
MAEKPTHVKMTLSIHGAERDPLSALRGLTKSAKSVQQHVPEIVEMARKQRCTWAEVGEALGTTRQSAWERFA